MLFLPVGSRHGDCGDPLVIAWFVAAKEALDLEWGQTIATVILGWLALVVIMIVAGVVLGLLGLGAAAVGGFFGL